MIKISAAGCLASIVLFVVTGNIFFAGFAVLNSYLLVKAVSAEPEVA